MNPIMILGSSKSDGKTFEFIKSLSDDKIPIIDINSLNISFFDYFHHNKDDDYIPLMERIISQYDTIVLATPVYWFSMSAQMKMFIDRTTDLTTFRKDLGRKLKNKNLFVISTYAGVLGKGFELPFQQICQYLNMQYLGCCYYYTGTDVELSS